MSVPPSSKQPRLTTVSCLNCGGEVAIRAQGLTMSVVCKACHSILDVSSETQALLSAGTGLSDIQPAIPLGTRGRLRGVDWEVIGFMQRVDGTGLYYWKEYLLFNPRQGFRWLTEFDGHWNYLVLTKEVPALTSGDRRARHMGKTYDLFHVGSAKVTYVMGEFYWRVKIGETVTVRDYICPPEILSSSLGDHELTWAVGEYVERDMVGAAFTVMEHLPRSIGVAPNQPSPYREADTAQLYRYWGLLSGAIVLLHVILLMIGTAIWSNFLVALGLLGVGPIVRLWGRNSFELQRWHTSDYSPYWTSENQDDS